MNKSVEFGGLFAEEMLKCVLMNNQIPWDHKWSGSKKDAKHVLPDLNVSRGLISETVNFALKSYRPLIVETVTDVWDGLANLLKDDLLLTKLRSVGLRFTSVKHGFFIYMAIVNDLSIRFYRSGQQQLVSDVLRALVVAMREMRMDSPESLNKSSLLFLEEMSKKSP